MNYRIFPVLTNDKGGCPQVMYMLEIRKHWWSDWKPLMGKDGSCVRLFNTKELQETESIIKKLF